MAKRGLDWIFASFEDRRMVILIGLICFAHFLLVFIPKNPLMARILPPWPVGIFAFLSAGVLIYQGIVWKVFQLFLPGWYKKPIVWLLFFCEFWVIVFAVTFLTWPLYPVYAFFMEASKRH